jgi:hypothetical protein
LFWKDQIDFPQKRWHLLKRGDTLMEAKDCSKRGGVTYQEWMSRRNSDFPPGFVESGFAYEYWQNLRSLDDALANWQTSIIKKRRDAFAA